jgi:hypothetical protein
MEEETEGFSGGGVTGSGKLNGGVCVPSLGVKGDSAISSVGNSKEGRWDRIKSSPARL